MQNRTLAANARGFRYTCYPLVVLAFLILQQPGWWQSIAALVWGCGWPPLIDFLQRGLRVRAILRWHVVEAGLAAMLLVATGMPPVLLAAVGIAIVVSNALQGGIEQALRAAATIGICSASAVVAMDYEAVSRNLSVDVFAGLFVLIYCTVLGHVAYVQALQRHGNQLEIRALNARLCQYLPSGLAVRLEASGSPRLQRNWLTVAFVDLVGFTRMVERMPVEELNLILDAYLECVASTARTHEGSVCKVLGDGVLLVFGEEGETSPQQLAHQCIACCRTLNERMSKLALQWQAVGVLETVQLRSGIASGYCSVGDWGGGERLEYTVIGAPVNLASRLQGAAARGQVLICERTARLVQDLIPLAPVTSRALKGIGVARYHAVAAGAFDPVPWSDKVPARV